MLDENELVRRISDSDHEAFKELFLRYYRPLALYARKFVVPESAGDLVQECFFQFWLNRKSFIVHTSLKAYLFAMLRHRCYHELKKKAALQHYENDTLQRLRYEEWRYFETEESIFYFDLIEKTKKSFDKLPPKCREVFELSRQRGLSNKDIAENLQISQKMVEKQITKALKIFRNELSDFLPLLIFCVPQSLLVVIRIVFF